LVEPVRKYWAQMSAKSADAMRAARLFPEPAAGEPYTILIMMHTIYVPPINLMRLTSDRLLIYHVFSFKSLDKRTIWAVSFFKKEQFLRCNFRKKHFWPCNYFGKRTILAVRLSKNLAFFVS
jgi:hypothetical protein